MVGLLQGAAMRELPTEIAGMSQLTRLDLMVNHLEVRRAAVSGLQGCQHAAAAGHRLAVQASKLLLSLTVGAQHGRG